MGDLKDKCKDEIFLTEEARAILKYAKPKDNRIINMKKRQAMENAFGNYCVKNDKI